MEYRVIIDTNGDMRFIYSDDLAEILNCGESTVKRASHVEPCEGGWHADLSPVNGPTLGPFKLRSEALGAELEWLNKNNIPIPA